jgi:hypothetical protein
MALAALIASAACGKGAPADEVTGEAQYLAENGAAMARMMNDMNVEPSGDVDRDFVTMMVPHHQGAIEMAIAVLKYGKNEQLKRIAQEIIVDQQQEIAAMKLAIGAPLPPANPAPTQPEVRPPAPSVPSPAIPENSPVGTPAGMDPKMKM